jgi:hypothetical protein
MTTPSPIYIGCDPAFRIRGFVVCILNMESKQAEFLTTDYDRYRDWISGPDAPEIGGACIENSALQNKLFYTHKSATGALLTPQQAKFIPGAKKLNTAELCSAAMAVGKNQAISEMSYRVTVMKYGVARVFGVSPLEKGKKITCPRMFSAYVASYGVTLVNYGGSQDERDAFKMAVMAVDKAKMAARYIKK